MVRFPPRKRPKITIHLAALIDIVFLLLIYFLLTSSFVEQEGISVSVPEMKTAELYSREIPVVIIDRSGQFYFAEKKVKDKELQGLLRTFLGLSSNKSVAIKADKRVAYDRVVRALEIAKESGAKTLNLTVDQKLQPSLKKDD